MGCGEEETTTKGVLVSTDITSCFIPPEAKSCSWLDS